MLDVTKPALNRLSRRLAHQAADDDMALRFTRHDGRWKLGPDHAQPGDISFANAGRNVLLLDQSTAEAMSNMRLDVRKTDAGPRLRLRRIARQEQ